MRHAHLPARMAAAAREMEDQHDPASTVKSAVALLVRNIEGCTSANVSLVYAKKRVETPAASDEAAAISGRLVRELGEGPCLDAIWNQEMLYVPDLAADPRWPTWGPRMIEETGVRSVLTFRLFTARDVVGALSMYSTKVDAFNDGDKAEGFALAAQIATAVAAAKKLDQFETALTSRTVIAQACGIIMERYQIDEVRAFAVLTRVSSTQNLKLRDVASDLVSTRVLPKAMPTNDA